ncbi:MAG TPA: tetratricopeptide repeat protein [Rhizomicrobium sp.]|nr:tetratricopeptide repeat protein [Rhizomicrobium sp.]
MAIPAVQRRIDEAAAIGAHARALTRLEALEEELESALARRKSNGALRRAVKAWRRGDIVRAGQLALEATEADATNAQAFHVLAMALERMGHMHKALVTYERAFALDPDDPDLLLNLGLSAWNMKMVDAAEKMFNLYIAACPDSPLGYNNLGTVMCDQGRSSIAIETLRAAIYRMPSQSILWNSLATVLAEDGRADESIVFYEEAIRLEPDFARPWHNLGFAYSHLGRLEEALGAYDHALSLAKDPTEIIEGRHSRGVCLIGMGRLAEGFADYEVRNDPRFRAYVQTVTKSPAWQGEELDGKRILAVAEQGLGDEFMFANILPDLARAVGGRGKLQIAVDPRLVTLFARSFPDAEVGTYDDRRLIDRDGNRELRFVPWAHKDGDPDFHVAMGSAIPRFRRTVADFPRAAFLRPDPDRVARYRGEIAGFGKGPRIGICWRSMMLAAKRGKYYSALDMWGPILKVPGVTFVNVQYGEVEEELRRAMERHGVPIHSVEGLDLKDDIDGAAALSGALDLVISAPTAAAAVAASVGTEVWFLTAGRTWPQLGTDKFPWYRDTRVFSPEKFADWASLMGEVATALETFSLTG